MLLAIDIGNTNISFGLFKDRHLLKKAVLPTSSVGSKVSRRKLERSFGRRKIEAVIICSVVPKAERALAAVLKKLFRKKPLILGKGVRVPIKNLYKKPRQVGQDRLVNAYAGSALYKTPLIIIDFGTAVTFDVISKKGAYLGGIIAPGMELSLSALSEKAALLPDINLRGKNLKAPSIVGKTTSESMRSGSIYGFASMCDGMVARLNKKFGIRFNVIATGGNARLISKFSASVKKIDENLTLEGINLIFQNSK